MSMEQRVLRHRQALILAWGSTAMLLTERELPICGGVQAVRCGDVGLKPETRMDRPSVTPEGTLTAHCKDASAE